MSAEKVYTDEEQLKIVTKIEKYIKDTSIPIVAEFAYQNDIRRTTLYDHPIISNAIKKLIDKKEAQLERDGLQKEKFTPMHAFSLKQLGWTDKTEIDNKHSFNGQEIADALKQSDTNTD